ncbi:MAG: zinc ribbon domain-containing protein, partial [Clostridia bacterium]|nr:zinc ribbon domain-containing protein [Clostridia bacterium]
MNENERSFDPVAGGESAGSLEEKLSECNKRIGELHGEIGKIYCLVAGDSPIPELDALVKEVRQNEKLAGEYTEWINAPADARPCPACGKPVAGGSQFCTFCGASLKEEAPVEKEAAEPAPEPVPEAAERVCPHCGTPARGDLPFCTACGKKIDEGPAPVAEPAPAEPAGRVCPVCGAPAVGDLPFCTFCGASLKEEAPVEKEAAEPAPEP